MELSGVEVSGYLPDEELRAETSCIATLVRARRYFSASASASLMRWLAGSRVVLMTASDTACQTARSGCFHTDDKPARLRLARSRRCRDRTYRSNTSSHSGAAVSPITATSIPCKRSSKASKPMLMRTRPRTPARPRDNASCLSLTTQSSRANAPSTHAAARPVLANVCRGRKQWRR